MKLLSFCLTFALACLLGATITNGEKPPEPDGDLLIVTNETSLHALIDGQLQPIVKLVRETVLKKHPPGKRIEAPENYAHVSFTHPTAGGPLFGWVDCQDTLDPAAFKKKVEPADEPKQAPAAEEQPEDLLDAPRVLDRLENAKDQWEKIQKLMLEAEEKGVKIPELYLARARLWSKLHNHDKALEDFVLAAQLATKAAPEGDLVETNRYYTTFYKEIKERIEVPSQPGSGDASAQYAKGVMAYRNGQQGVMAYRKKQLKYAKRYFENAIQVKRDRAIYHYYLALTHVSLSDLEDDPAKKEQLVAKAVGNVRQGTAHEHSKEKPLTYFKRREIDRALVSVQGRLRDWLERLRPGEAHYDPVNDPDLPEELKPDSKPVPQT
jgi:tetratricopeptide (TPR) repeat protein